MFVPWKGNKFGESDNILGGMRLIVLGEAHYGDKIGWSDPGFTAWIVQQYIDGQNKYRFFSRVANIVLGTSGHVPADRRAAFWNSVVFFNYIPVMAATGARQRPSQEMWEGDAPANFLRYVDEFEAEAILVCGTDLWRRLPTATGEHFRYCAGDRDCDAREHGRVRAIAAHIPHPTRRPASNMRCRPVVQFLRDRVAARRSEDDAVMGTGD